ncbi:hypothetical protein D4R99_05595 [bacterium]|nr:MAG: hypothetical protein D4R99_05595 [bacterium]
MASLRTKLVVQKISEIIRNSGNNESICMGKILREAGYSKQTSLKPKLVTETNGYKEEMAKLLPDLVLVNKHEELLNAYKLKTTRIDKRLSDKEIKEIVEGLPDCKVRDIVRNKNSGSAVCRYWAPDYMTRLSALDMMYKIMGYYHQHKQSANNPVEVRFINYADTKHTT